MRVFIVLIWCFWFVGVDAQNRSIVFREGNWEKILKQAKKEKKLILVDCYTSWCGPCKMLAKNVFTQDKVADFYNTEFVCVKMDMEKGEGPALAKKYEVQAFPTLLYIDSKGELKHCVVGMQDADVLIGNGRTALSGEASLETLQARYEAGERDEAFVKQYMEVLYKAYRPKLQKEVVTAYIDSLSEKEFYSRATWELIIKNLSDPLSPLVKKVMANKYRFYPVVARDTVDIYLDYTLRSAVNSFVWWNPQKSAFNQERYEALLGYVSGLNFPKVPQYVATLLAVKQVAEGDLRGMLDEMYRSLGYGIFYNPDAKLDFIRGLLQHVEISGNEELLKEADGWLDRLIAGTDYGYYKSEYMRVKAKIQRAMGNEEKAAELEKEAPNVRMMR